MSRATVEGATKHFSVSEEVILAVAAATDVDPLDLDPLSEVIDPDALDALYERDEFGRSRSPEHVEFTYDGRRVVVGEDGSVTVSELSPEGS